MREKLGYLDTALIIIAAILIGIEYGWMTGVATGFLAHAIRTYN